MPRTEDRELTVEEAARIIYSTPTPTEQQKGKVRDKLRRGTLRRSPRSPWSTTAWAVAEYLAARTSPQHRRPGAPKDLQGLYGGLLRDYFLALVLRRRAAGRSRLFQRTVVAGQVVVLAASLWLIATIALKTRSAMAPERAAVQEWLEANIRGRYRIVEWFPPRPSDEGVTLRLRYQYFTPGRKGIVTDREFEVVEGRVVSTRQTQ